MAKNPEVQRIRRALRKQKSGFAKYARGFYRIQKATGIDGLYWASLAESESGHSGESTPANAPHNYFGWRVYTGDQSASGNVSQFANAPSSFTYMAQQFAKSPYSKAKSVFDKVWDPYAADPNHERNIAAIYKQLGGNPGNIRVGKGAGAPDNPKHFTPPKPGMVGVTGSTTTPNPNYEKNMKQARTNLVSQLMANNTALAAGGQMDTAATISAYKSYSTAKYANQTITTNRDPAPRGRPGGGGKNGAPTMASGKVMGNFTMGGGPSAHGSRPLGNWQSDHAWDLMAKPGTPIYAISDGQITGNFGFTSNGSTVWGRRLTLTFKGGKNAAFYTHMGKYAKGIKPGAKVKKGQLIGFVGDPPGFASHLHIGLEHGDLFDYVQGG